ncbi:MAG TPA: von Willebrand factor type A domain-containing protein [Terriglobia bacterium]|nr:von Willebrand factor type A domain-containing protein [Terriglobia bacterium]
MNINYDDPKWTAYVLGELNAGERQAVERELEASEELRAFVEELQIAAFAMKDAVAREGTLSLTFQQRKAVRAAAAEPAVSRWFGPAARWAVGLAAAASVALLIAPSLWRNGPVEEPTQMAKNLAHAGAAADERSVPGADRVTPPAPAGKASEAAPAGPVREEAKVELSAKAAVPSEAAPGAAISQAKKALNSPEGQVRDRAAQGQAQVDSLQGLPAPVIAAPPSLVAQNASPIAAEARGGRGGGAAGGAGGGAGGGGGAGKVAGIGESAGPGPGREARIGGSGIGSGQGIGSGIGDGNGHGIGPGASAGAAAPQFSQLQLAPPPVAVAQRAAPSAPMPTAPVPPVGIGTVVPGPNNSVASRLDGPNNETYDLIGDNPFIFVSRQQVATFSSDVDTASYANIRRFINAGQLPPRAAVRIEELVNYFTYDYPRAGSDHPITANIEAAPAPWNPEHRLVRVGIKAKDAQIGEKPSNLVFLIDVSGSMEPAERLPLLKSGLRMLAQRLTENDRVSIVTYSGQSGVALPPTNGTRKDVILQAIDSLRAEGSTNGGEGIRTAYSLAASNFIRGGVNRVVLMTDGDFNVGITNQNDLVRLIEDQARTGVFLSVLGVGTGNVKDSTMEQLADHGNGQYAYIDSLNEARKVLVDQMGGTLITVAKDVKLQVEFNPAQVSAYRLVGYENRVLTSPDFNDDRKDAGDMGAGHTVTALFEVVPVGVEINNFPGAGPLRYQPEPSRAVPAVNATVAKELLNLRIRYKDPEGAESKLIDFPLVDRGQAFASASVDFRFAAAVAEFGMLLRDSPYRGASSWTSVISVARESRGSDREGYREEFIRLVERCAELARVAVR